MSWLVWRQYRWQAVIAALVIAVFAAVIVVTGLQMAAQWHSILLSCSANGTCGDFGQGQSPSLGGVFGHDFAILSLMAPALFGMLVGAPLVASELETRSCDWAWAQSLTRTRWLAIKVGWLLVAAAVWGGVISALVTWWSGPRNAMTGDALQANTFDMQGLVPVGYAVFATALGIAAGTLLRRTLPAVGIVLGGFIGMRLWISQDVRMHLLSPVTTYFGMAANFGPPAGSVGIGGGFVNKAGQVIPAQSGGTGVDAVPLSALPAACQKLLHGGGASLARGGPPAGTGPAKAGLSCLQHAGFRQFLSYQPASRYWAFQGIETGIYVAVAALLMAVTFYVVRNRDA